MEVVTYIVMNILGYVKDEKLLIEPHNDLTYFHRAECETVSI